MEIITPGHIVQELQRITQEMDKGANALYDAECKMADAEAVAEEPHIVIGNVTDKLMRFRPMGWYGVLGFARYREEALYRIESGSSIAAL